MEPKATIAGTLGSHEVRWPDKRHGPWVVAIHLAEIDGRVECAGFEIAPVDPKRPTPLRSGNLRMLPFATLVQAAIEVHLRGRDVVAEFGSPDIVERAKRQRPALRQTLEHPSGRPPAYPP